MTLRMIGCLAAFIGGVCWLARWGLTLAGVADDGVLADGLFWAGAVLLTVAMFVAGTRIAAVLPLRIVVGLCGPVFGWAVIATVADLVPPDPAYAGFGLLFLVAGVVAASRPAPASSRRGSRGSHAR